jgi:hypothetical protein
MRPIAPRISILSGLLVALLLAGCGGGNGGSDNAQAPASGSKAKPARKAAYGLGPHLVAPGELQGFTPSEIRSSNKPIDWLSLGGLAPEGYRKESRRLKSLGFVAGANERLQSTGESAAEGVSIVERFKSPAAAKSEFQTQVERSKTSSAGRFVPFPVPGVPGAKGFDLPGPKSSGHNVAFTDSSYYHLIGTGWAKGEKDPPTRAGVIAAAQSLYKRLQGKPGAS